MESEHFCDECVPSAGGRSHQTLSLLRSPRRTRGRRFHPCRRRCRVSYLLISGMRAGRNLVNPAFTFCERSCQNGTFCFQTPRVALPSFLPPHRLAVIPLKVGVALSPQQVLQLRKTEGRKYVRKKKFNSTSGCYPNKQLWQEPFLEQGET